MTKEEQIRQIMSMAGLTLEEKEASIQAVLRDAVIDKTYDEMTAQERHDRIVAQSREQAEATKKRVAAYNERKALEAEEAEKESLRKETEKKSIAEHREEVNNMRAIMNELPDGVLVSDKDKLISKESLKYMQYKAIYKLYDDLSVKYPDTMAKAAEKAGLLDWYNREKTIIEEVDKETISESSEQSKEEPNIAEMPSDDKEASDFTSRVIADFNKELEQQEANNEQNQLNDASKDMENTLVVSNILQSKQAENKQDEVDFNVEQPHENDEPEEYEANNGKTLFEKAKEKWNGILSTEGEERKTVKKIATGTAIVAAVVATAKIATMVLNPLLGATLTGGAAYLGGNYMKGRKL